jgi:hypothetical protein
VGGPKKGEGEPPTPRVVVASERSNPEKIDWSALGAVGALVASISYLILNSAYVEFYESIGVRPEDVGLDRLAVLGRALGPALFALVLYAVFFGLLVLISLLLDKFRSPSASQSQTSSPGDARIRRSRVRPGVAGLLACLVVLLVVHVAVDRSSERAELVENGNHVSPVRFMGQLLIDVNVDYARIHWLDKDVPPPPLFHDPWLLYFGSNGHVAVFTACGTTVIVPANKVVPEVLTTKVARQREGVTVSERGVRFTPREERAKREDLCAKLKS